MRIIAGSARRLPLKTPVGMGTRPTTDRIKETLFNILQTDLPGSYFLDLFAGSGQIGLEALSRGAAYTVFVDKEKNACDCIEDNIRFTKLSGRSSLLKMDALAALSALEGKYTFDLVFLDPPYKSDLDTEVLEHLSGSSLLKAEAKLIVEADLKKDFSFAARLGYKLLREKTYKSNKHVFLTKAENSL